MANSAAHLVNGELAQMEAKWQWRAKARMALASAAASAMRIGEAVAQWHGGAKIISWRR